MAIHAQTSCTLSTITDVEAVYTYYYLSDSTITVDEAPKDGVNAPGAQTITVISDGESYVWQLTEPELDIEDDIIQSAVGKLYYIECVKFSNGTYDWGPLMTSSTYAAAKAAYNLSYQAIQQAQAANEATALLGGHFIYKSTASASGLTSPSANVVQTVVDNGIDVSDDPTKWEYNTHIGANGIRLRYNETVLSEWKTNSLTFFKPNTTYPALNLTGTAITFYNPSNNNAQLIIGANGALQSGGYTRGSDSKFSSNGTKIDLANGDIITKYFRISQGLENGLTPGAYIYGTIEALDGTIGTDSTNYWEIGNGTDYLLHDTAKIIGHGSSYIQLGDLSTWRLATNRIHTGWYVSGDTLLHYPQINSKYWDFGIHIPNSDSPSGRGNDKFIYIRSSKADSSIDNALRNLLQDIDDNSENAQWDYQFWIDKEGKVHAPGFYIGNSMTPIGGGAGTIAEKLLVGAGSSTRPVYFRSDSETVDGETIDHTGEVAVVSWDVKTTLNNSNYEVPTSAAVKTFVENKGYLTSYTETDPTVPAWAKQSTKPTYSYSEINGTVPQSALPSYVDDVLEYNNYASLPNSGESGKIYITTNDNKTYRWGGTDYVEISSSLALGETESTAYRGDRGAAAYTHAVTNKGSAFVNGFYKITTNSEGHVTTATAVAKSDITGLGIPGENTDTKVNVSTRGTTKAYILGTTSSPTSTKTAREAVAETGVYLETSNSATRLIAPTFVGNLTGTASGNLTSADLPSELPNPKSLKLQVYNGTSTSTDTTYKGGESNNSIVSVAGTNAITNISASAASGGSTTFTLTKADGSTGTFDVTVTASVATGATKLTNSSGDGIDAGGATTAPVYFSNGLPIAVQSIPWSLISGAPSTYAVDLAKYNVLGGVKPAYSWTNAATFTNPTYIGTAAPTVNARQSTAGRYYAIEIDKNGRLFVNVPWSDTIPTQTNSSTTGVTINDHSTTTIYGVSSSTTSVTGVSGSTSVRGVKTDSTTTASKASGANGSASSWAFESKTVTKNPSFTYNSSDTSLTISFGTETVYSKSGGSNGTAPTWSFTDVTVPIMANSNTTVPIAAANATTVPIKNSSSTTVVTSKTHTVNDSGHSHTI